MAKKKIDKDWVVRIKYSPRLRLAVLLPFNTRAIMDTNLFKRTDKLEDGSKDVTYGLELDKETYKKLKRALGA